MIEGCSSTLRSTSSARCLAILCNVPKKTENSRPLHRSTRSKKTATPEPSSDSGRISRSPTPSWSTNANAGHDGVGQHTECGAPQSAEDPLDEDPFMPRSVEIFLPRTRMTKHRKVSRRCVCLRWVQPVSKLAPPLAHCIENNVE